MSTDSDQTEAAPVATVPADPVEQASGRVARAPGGRRAANPSAAAGTTRAKRPVARTAGASDAGAASAARVPRSPRGATGTRLPWLLALVGLIGTVGFAIAWQRADGGTTTTVAGEGATAPMLGRAREFSEALTNFDGATIDRDFDRIVALSTGEFRTQVDGFFSSEVRQQLKEAQASSRGEVRSAFVQSFDADRGSVFVVADQTIANNQSPQPQADTLRMELGLALVDGAWRVERVEVLTAPSGGATAGGATQGTLPGSPDPGD